MELYRECTESGAVQTTISLSIEKKFKRNLTGMYMLLLEADLMRFTVRVLRPS